LAEHRFKIFIKWKMSALKLPQKHKWTACSWFVVFVFINSFFAVLALCQWGLGWEGDKRRKATTGKKQLKY